MVLTGEPLALWLVPVADLGGVARHVLDAAEVGVPGHRLAVLCPPGPLADRLRAAGADVTTGPVGPEHGVRASVAAVRRAVRSRRPAVLHAHLAWADVVAAAATAGTRTALVSTEHGIADDALVHHRSAWRAHGRRALHTARMRRVDAVVAVSGATAGSVRHAWRPGRRTLLRVVHNGVDPLPTRRPRDPGLHVAAVSRLAPEKRVDAVLRSFAVLCGEHPAARLTVAGTGPEAVPLRQLATELGVADRTRFAGHVDAPSLLATTDVLVQLSAWENCSYSLLDGLVHGCGVVATGVGGNPEILPPGALVPADDPGAVAAAVTRQGLDPAARPTLDPAWPTRARMTAAVAEVYAAVLGVRP